MFEHRTQPPSLERVVGGLDGLDDARYEYRQLTLGRDTTRQEARALMTEHAEYGRWELARVRLYRGGARRVWLRRRIMRVERSS